MKTEKLNVNRCFKIDEPDRDDINLHRWRDEPAIGLTEAGPIAWWICTRCPARTLHDPETEDGFAAEPIVVYPPSCFGEDKLEPGRELLDPAGKIWRVLRVGAAEDAEREAREELCVAGVGPIVVLQAAGGGTLSGRASVFRDWIVLPQCPCPRRASGAREHLGGCVASALAMDSIIVHPPTDPAPPSEELRRAIADALDEDDIPTARIPTATIFGHPLDPAAA